MREILGDKKTLTGESAFEIFQEFYFGYDVDNFAKESNLDMALFQCGFYNLEGVDKFEFDFTRQLTFRDDSGYSNMKQLHFTTYYDVQLASSKELTFHAWYSPENGKQKWLDQVAASKGYRLVKDIDTEEVKILYENV